MLILIDVNRDLKIVAHLKSVSRKECKKVGALWRSANRYLRINVQKFDSRLRSIVFKFFAFLFIKKERRYFL
jgi:hypothetical protein